MIWRRIVRAWVLRREMKRLRATERGFSWAMVEYYLRHTDVSVIYATSEEGWPQSQCATDFDSGAMIAIAAIERQAAEKKAGEMLVATMQSDFDTARKLLDEAIASRDRWRKIADTRKSDTNKQVVWSEEKEP